MSVLWLQSIVPQVTKKLINAGLITVHTTDYTWQIH